MEAGSVIDGRARCAANLRQPRADGDDRPAVCLKSPGHDTDHPGIGRCSDHGGNTATHRRNAIKVEAIAAVELWGGRRDIHEAEALLELVQWKAAEVQAWRAQVAQLSYDELTWGTTKIKTGGDDRGETEEAKPHIAYVMLRDAERDLANYASMALKAGVNAAMVRIAESQAAKLVLAMDRFANDPRVTVVGDVRSVVLDAIREVAAQ